MEDWGRKMDTEMDAWIFCRALIVLNVRIFPAVLERRDLLLLSLERQAGFCEIRKKQNSLQSLLLAAIKGWNAAFAKSASSFIWSLWLYQYNCQSQEIPLITLPFT